MWMSPKNLRREDAQRQKKLPQVIETIGIKFTLCNIYVIFRCRIAGEVRFCFPLQVPPLAHLLFCFTVKNVKLICFDKTDWGFPICLLNCLELVASSTRSNSYKEQECIPVGCIPSAAVAVSTATHALPPCHAPLPCHTPPHHKFPLPYMPLPVNRMTDRQV